MYWKNNELHVWAGDPDGLYCLIHSDPAYQVLCQLTGETPPCCLDRIVEWKDKDGALHRDDGPAQIEANGRQRWCQHGKYHRDDGPAIMHPDGSLSWWQHDKRHRDDGPAMIRPDGTQEWWWYGKRVTEEEHARLQAQSLGI